LVRGEKLAREAAVMTVIRNAFVYDPRPLGVRDILIAGGRVEALAEPGKIRLEGLPAEELEAQGKIVAPGLIDSHVHILGGGGEGGPATRAPEIHIEEIVQSGVTTVIGCLGTDGVTRHLTSLLAKARALEIEGISTYIFAGSYEIPPVTLTGSLRSDLVLIDKVIGAGEIAVSDHRSSQPTFEEVARLAAECRVGGMLGGKAGVLHLHLGDGQRRLEMLFRLVAETEIPASQVIPTHVNRNPELLEEAVRWALSGGFIDLTAGPEPELGSPELSIEKAIAYCLERQVPLTRITVSSDANGSVPVFDPSGNLIGLTVATPKNLLHAFRALVQKKIVGVEDALRLFGTNAAGFYKLTAKGGISPGKDADIILFDENFGLTDVLARGQRMMADGRLVVQRTFAPLDGGR
jgi:beta-aspartyl-dipeptidase (metallo-type)